MKSGQVYLVAAERSGDLLGADLVRALKAQPDCDLEFAGVGGDAMAAEGVDSLFPLGELSILGWIDGLKAYRRVKARVAETVADILDKKPDVVVLIDSWGFTLRVAQGVRAAAPEIKLIKYVGPQVFATRAGRARTLADSVDHLLTILNFDAPYYDAFDLPVTFVGNPTLDRLPAGDGAAFRVRHAIRPDQQAIIVLFGSRASEIKRMNEALARAVARLKTRDPDRAIIIPVAGTVDAMLRARLVQDARFEDAILIDESEKADAFYAADAALACSGTVVTELATAGVPTVTGYRLGWITWGIARGFNLMKAPYISLVNMAAGRLLIPEFVQTRCTGKNLAEAVEDLLADAETRTVISRGLRSAAASMRGDGDASARAAEIVRSYLPQ